jgi:hypothetical protein
MIWKETHVLSGVLCDLISLNATNSRTIGPPATENIAATALSRIEQYEKTLQVCVRLVGEVLVITEHCNSRTQRQQPCWTQVSTHIHNFTDSSDYFLILIAVSSTIVSRIFAKRFLPQNSIYLSCPPTLTAC